MTNVLCHLANVPKFKPTNFANKKRVQLLTSTAFFVKIVNNRKISVIFLFEICSPWAVKLSLLLNKQSLNCQSKDNSLSSFLEKF